MKHLFKIVLATSALVAIAGTATAQDTFDVKFSYDSSAPAEVTYARLLATAKEPCQIQYPLSTTGYSREAMKRFRKKCEHMLIEQAITSIENASLTALHNASTGKRPETTKLVNAQPASKPQP